MHGTCTVQACVCILAHCTILGGTEAPPRYREAVRPCDLRPCRAAVVRRRSASLEGLVALAAPQALGNGTTVLVGMPGAFTPTCSDKHLPGFIKQVRAR